MKLFILKIFLLLILSFSFLNKSFCQYEHIEKLPSIDEIERHKYEAAHKAKKIKFSRYEEKNVKNIILMIGDGMGVAQAYAALIANKGSLYLEQFPITGFIKTNSANSLITDSGASATAMATGKKTNNGMIGVDPSNRPLKNIIEFAIHHGLGTGLVATSTISHATPAAFVAHEFSRQYYQRIAADIVRSGVDVFIGGGRNHFTRRFDKLNLEDELRERNYTVIDTLDALENAGGNKIAGLLYAESPPGIMEGRGNMLSIATQKAIHVLSGLDKGFFLMVEGSQIDWGNHSENILYQTEETLDFDRAIGEVLEFAVQDGSTLVIVTADHETGGLAIKDGNLRKGIVYGDYTTSHHTGVMVPVYAFGPSSELFSGIYDNTDIFNKMMEAYGWKK